MSLPQFFFDRVSAEIRQQMDGVQALADQLSRLPLPDDAKGCVAGIADAAAGVTRTLERALDLRGVATQGLTLQPAPLRLRELLDDVAARWRPRANAAGVTLHTSYDGAPEAQVLGDRSRLIQVFDGLLGEAVASAARGAVEVTLRAAPATGGVKLQGRVRGGATGRDAQPEEDRVRDVADKLGLEVALGAMLARRIVAGLSGVVTHESNAGDAGTAWFEILLPAAADASAAPAPAPEARPAHVLVVDDNATNRVVAQALCEMLGCTSEAAEDGFAAVEAARRGRFDLILMDIRMPRLDGLAATHEIRKLPGKAGEAPIVALTANVDPDDANAYMAAGMCGVLEKPMKADDLRQALRKALAGRADVAAA
ncbi:response regulator [Phenylobacterium sp.]|jgi:CheY-like chemotaxis protein|uniref:response regulator n=1 Tax=Phenylobacterium sp. TaxID=1871053 RepID=UPI002F931A95